MVGNMMDMKKLLASSASRGWAAAVNRVNFMSNAKRNCLSNQ